MNDAQRAALVDHDIEQVLRYTAQRFGIAKAKDIRALVIEALEDVHAYPSIGRRRPDVHPSARVYPIGSTGWRARHLVLYELGEDKAPRIYAFAYDGRNLRRLWQERQ